MVAVVTTISMVEMVMIISTARLEETIYTEETTMILFMAELLVTRFMERAELTI